MTWLALVAVVVLVGLHEWLVARAAVRPRPVVRVAVLALLLAAVAVFAVRASLGERVAAWAAQVAPATPAVAFEASGDPLLAAALEAQRPARPYPEGGSAADVEAWQQHIVDTLRARIDYDSAAAVSSAPETLASEVVGDVRRTLVRFRSWDGTSIPAYVLEPLGARRPGGVLVVPGHGAGIRATAGLVRDYQHEAALALARAGHVTLTPELRGFGLLTPDGEPRHRAVAAAAIEAGTFYKAVVVKDLAVALGVLARWPGVDGGPVAVAGASLGGELAVFLGVLDDRVRAVATHSYGGAVGPTTVDDEATDDARQTPHGCHTIPGSNQLVWQEDWFRLLAPRPVLLVRGTTNTPRETETLVASASAAYDALGAPGAFRFIAADGGHEFYVEPTSQFFGNDSWLPPSPPSGS